MEPSCVVGGVHRVSWCWLGQPGVCDLGPEAAHNLEPQLLYDNLRASGVSVPGSEQALQTSNDTWPSPMEPARVEVI